MPTTGAVRLVLAAAEIIAAEGIGALTNQRIAERLSASTTVVTHYFQNKRELVLHTYETMASRSRARVEQAIEHSADPLAAGLHTHSCLSTPRPWSSGRSGWRIQGMSVGDRELTDIWASRSASAVEAHRPPARGRYGRRPHPGPHRHGERSRAAVRARPGHVFSVAGRSRTLAVPASAPHRRSRIGAPAQRGHRWAK